MRHYERLDGSLRERLLDYWRADRRDETLLEIALRLGEEEAYELLRDSIDLSDESLNARRIALLREFARPDLIPALLPKVDSSASLEMPDGVLSVVGSFSAPDIADHLLAVYESLSPEGRRAVRQTLFARPEAAMGFLEQIERGRIQPDEVATEELRRLALHQSEALDSLVRKHWGNVGPGSSEEKLATMRRFSNDLRGRRRSRRWPASVSETLRQLPSIALRRREDRS